MINISTETWQHIYNYKIFTTYHSSFPALTVTYRLDGKKYGEDMSIDVSWGSGGTKPLIEMDDYITFSKEMSSAWKAATKIVKHHKKSKEIYKETK